MSISFCMWKYTGTTSTIQCIADIVSKVLELTKDTFNFLHSENTYKPRAIRSPNGKFLILCPRFYGRSKSIICCPSNYSISHNKWYDREWWRTVIWSVTLLCWITCQARARSQIWNFFSNAKGSFITKCSQLLTNDRWLVSPLICNSSNYLSPNRSGFVFQVFKKNPSNHNHH